MESTIDDWPTSVRFLASNEWTVEKKPHRRLRIPGIEARLIDETGHPCRGQLGVFAMRAWERFEIVGEYVGMVKAPTVEGAYVLALQSDLPQTEALSLDAGDAGNELRFVNDFRGVATGANVAFRSTTVNGLPVRMLVVLEDLAYGAELLVDYGFDYWSALGVEENSEETPSKSDISTRETEIRKNRQSTLRRNEEDDELSSDDEDKVTSDLMAACLEDDEDDDDEALGDDDEE